MQTRIQDQSRVQTGEQSEENKANQQTWWNKEKEEKKK